MSRHEKFQRSEFRHNPYIGTFQRTQGAKPDINMHNPYIGYVNRHAPDAADAHGSSVEKPFRRNFISHISISQRRPVNMLALKNLPLSLFTQASVKPDEDGPVCAICLEAFNDGDELRELNCSHCFHRACVDIWLLGTLSDDIQLNGTCPTCRQHAAPCSPGMKKGTLHITVATPFRSNEENMSDLSIPSSSVTSSSAARSGNSFDILSPISPGWSGQDEENCLHIGQLLTSGAGIDDEDEVMSVELSINSSIESSIASLEYSLCQFESALPFPPNVSSSNLDDILEDEPSLVEMPPPQPASIAKPAASPRPLSIDDCDVESVFSLSQYSDCGFPLSSPQSSSAGRSQSRREGD